MSNIFTNVFNSKSIGSIQDKTLLTKAQADLLYINSSGSDQLNGNIIIVGTEEIKGVALFDSVPALNSNLSKTDIINPLHLVNKDYVDNQQSTTISTQLNVSNSMTANFDTSVKFKYVPEVQSELSSTILNDTQLTSKKYVDDKINNSVILSPNCWSFGMGSFSYQIPNTADYLLEVPNLGTSTTKTLVAAQYSKSVYINWPININENGLAKYNLKHGCWCDFSHSINMCNGVDSTNVTNYGN
jgi:hypothetical protein